MKRTVLFEKKLVRPVIRENPYRFQDKALKWARENPQIAQACLDVPADPSQHESGVTKSSLSRIDSQSQSSFRLRGIDDYWLQRKWTFRSCTSNNDLPLVRSLASHVLSAPLTIASFLLVNDHSISASTSPLIQTHRLCCVGARAEASLPSQYWREILVVLSWQLSCPVYLQLDFVGPDVVPRPNEKHEFHGSTIDLRWPFVGKYHDYVSNNKERQLADPDYHGFVLFNPGLGHTNLKADWISTIDLLFQQRQLVSHSFTPRLLLTAHSAVDADRETVYIEKNYGVSISYKENPFASRITYEDPFDASHVVRPNQFYVYL